MKVALVHDYLINYGGAERVLEAIAEIYPKAPIYTLIVDKKGMGKFWKNFRSIRLTTSWFNYLPFASKIISPLRFLLPLLWSSFDFSDYDVIIGSASWAVTKGFKKRANSIEICYLHSPPRYLYGYDTSRNWKTKWFATLVDIYALLVNHFMRQYDFLHAQKPAPPDWRGVNYFIANSNNTGKRIEKFYRRKDYKVIYPPVDIDKIVNSRVEPVKGDYFLTGGRLVAAKNFDLIIKVCRKIKVNLKIFGEGIEEKNLKAFSSDNIEFLGNISDNELISYYKGAKALILAQKDEDFGITPLEAMAAGTPVIAYRGGGYLESVKEGKTGIFFDELTVDSLTKAIRQYHDSNHSTINSANCIAQAKKFSKEKFKSKIKKFVEEKYNDRRV